MFAVALGDRVHDAPCVLPVDGAGMIVVFARARSPRPSLGIDRQNLGVLADQPGGRRAGWRTEHDTQILAGEAVNRAIKPIPVPLLERRLDARPGEFTDPRPGESQLAHPGRVEIPTIIRPMFRVIANPERKGCRQ